MGANIYWQPKKGRVLSCDAPSALLTALGIERMQEFTSEDIQFLRGLKAGAPSFAEAVDELIEAIEKHERIQVWPEY